MDVLSVSQGYICVLDTHAFLPKGKRGRRIIHAPDLGWSCLPFEYLIHGPVRGPAFRCVPIKEIRRVLDCPRFPFCPQPHGVSLPTPTHTPAQTPPRTPSQTMPKTTSKTMSKTMSKSAPAPQQPAIDPADPLAQFTHLLARHTIPNPVETSSSAPHTTPARHHIPTRDEVSYAVRVGTLFQRPGDPTVDVILAIAAFMLARTQINITIASATPVEETWLSANLFVTGPGAPIDMTVEPSVVQAIAGHLFPPGVALPSVSDIRIVNTDMDTVAQPQLQWAKNLLVRVEAFWRSLVKVPLAENSQEWMKKVKRLEPGKGHRCKPVPWKEPGTERVEKRFYVNPPRRCEPLPHGIELVKDESSASTLGRRCLGSCVSAEGNDSS